MQSTRHRNDRNVHTHIHTLKPVCVRDEVSVLWNQQVHTNTEVMTIIPDRVITKEETEQAY